jgi:putative polyketide hydroxylase
MADDTIDVPVLIVGAGPVGLTLALALERFGIRSLIVESHHKVSRHPRARFVNARTMEIFRQLGIEPAVRALAIPDGLASTVIWAPTLSAPEIRQVEIETLGPASGEPLSPAPGLCTSQDLLDPVLHQAVLADGRSEVRFGWRLSGLEQDRSGVTATCLDDTGRSSTLRARYLVGADGPHSTVRDLCGIAMQGPAALGHTINIHFRADLTAHLRGRSVNLAMILNPAQPGLLLNIDGRQTWTAQAIFSPAAGPSPEEFDEDRCRKVVRAQVGDSDLDVHILGIAPWTSAARVADRFADGRVFLVGDAAQEMPPAGGFGMNVGIQEAHNLAWKLAAVVDGWADPNLLATYGEERLPLGRWITEQALLNLKSVGRVESPDGGPPQVKLGRPEFFRERGMVFGAAYTSAAVIPDGTERPQVANAVTDYVPSATPGCRAPHVWVDLDGKRTSTLDLMGDGFVLIDTGSDPSESSRVEGIAADGRVPFRTAVCSDPALPQAYGLAPGGMALIRPDGHVGWRTAHGAASSAEILAALDSILSRSDLESAAQPDRAETPAR